MGFLAGSFLPGARGRLVSGSSPSAAWSISASLLKPSTPPSPTKHSKCSFGRERQGGNRLDRVGFLTFTTAAITSAISSTDIDPVLKATLSASEGL